jgi:hypothetical protein
VKAKVKVRRWVEGDGIHVHVTVSMSLAVLVEFSVEGVRGKGNGR